MPLAIGTCVAVEDVVARVEPDRSFAPRLLEVDVPPREARGRVIAREPERMRVAEAMEHDGVGAGPDALGVAAVPLEQHPVAGATVSTGSNPPARPRWHEENDAPPIVPHDGPRESCLNDPLFPVDGAPYDGVAGFPLHAIRLMPGARGR